MLVNKGNVWIINENACIIKYAPVRNFFQFLYQTTSQRKWETNESNCGRSTCKISRKERRLNSPTSLGLSRPKFCIKRGGRGRLKSYKLDYDWGKKGTADYWTAVNERLRLCMFSLKNSIRIIIILTVNSFIFIEMGVTLLFKIFGGDSLAKASHDSRQQLDRYAFVFFNLLYVCVFLYL